MRVERRPAPTLNAVVKSDGPVVMTGYYASNGLMVAAIQLAIMLGAAWGGLLLDHISLTATWIGGIILLLLASLTVGNGRRLQPARIAS